MSLIYININSNDYKINKIETQSQENLFLDMLNETGDKSKIEKIFSLPDEEFYSALDFNSSITSWNDYLQPKFKYNSLNEIKEIDIEQQKYDNYLLGMSFFNENKGFKNFYLDEFEENLRKETEDCDLLDKLFFTVDFNSIWGGIFTNYYEEVICNNHPKVDKIIQGIDENNSFFKYDNEKNNIESENSNLNEINLLDHKKYMNYIYFFSDLIQNDSTILYSPIKIFENNKFFEDLFDFNSNHQSQSSEISNISSLRLYYNTSILALDNINMLIPFMTKKSKSSFTKTNNSHLLNMISNQNKYINFLHSDISFNLNDEIEYKYLNNNQKFINNGLLFNYNMNIKQKIRENSLNTACSDLIKRFNWNKHFLYLSRYRLSSYSITHGYNNNHKLMTSQFDKFLNLTTCSNYSSSDCIPTPLSFPKFIYPHGKSNENKKKFMSTLSLMSLYSHDYLYCNNFLSDIPKYINQNRFAVEKYLKQIDYSKFFEISDRVEDLYKLFDFYENFKELNYNDDSDNDY